MKNTPLTYHPSVPLPGQYVAAITGMHRDSKEIYINYDFATGDHAGWADITYITIGCCRKFSFTMISRK